MRTAYITCDGPIWFDIAEQMQRERDWQPVYWIVDPGSVPAIRQRFPGAIAHVRHDAYEMVSPPELADMVVEPLDEPFLREMSHAEVVALKMMDVMDSVDAFDFEERRRFYQQRLCYWRAVFRAVQPEVAVFAFSGHAIYDYLFYELCRQSGVRTLMFETTFNWALMFVMDDAMAGSPLVKATYDRLRLQHTGDVELPEFCETYLARLSGKYGDALPWYMRDQYQNFPKEVAAKLYQFDDEAPVGAAWRRAWRQWRRRVRSPRASARV